MRITFSHDHLNHDRHDFIEGILTSRPAWFSADNTFDVAGALILHQSPNLSDEDLNDLLDTDASQGQKTVPEQG